MLVLVEELIVSTWELQRHFKTLNPLQEFNR